MTTENMIRMCRALYRRWFYEHMNDEFVPLLILMIPVLLDKIECMQRTLDKRVGP